MIKAAFAVDGDVISEHFGKTRGFLFVTFDDGGEVERELLPPPAGEHVPGLFPNWIKSTGANLVVAGGMGAQAKTMFKSMGVDVCTVQSMTVEEAVQALLSGSLHGVEMDCSHGHESSCGK